MNSRGLFFSICIMAMCAAGAMAVTLELEPIEASDSVWVLDTLPDLNASTGGVTPAELRLGYDASLTRTYHAFQKYDLSGVPAGAQIESAMLHIQVKGGSATVNLGWYDVNDSSWDELTVTWNTQPTMADEPFLVTGQTGPSGRCPDELSQLSLCPVDVTGSVAAAFDADATDWSVGIKDISGLTTTTYSPFENRNGLTNTLGETTYRAFLVVTASLECNVHDLTNDCVVDMDDLAVLISDWLECGWLDETACP